MAHQRGRRLALLVISTVFTTTLAAQAAIIRVPGDQPTIKAGVNAASDGDEVVIADGVYTGEGNRHISVRGKVITVRSENGPAMCIVDCEGKGGGFSLDTSSTVEGLTITNGAAIYGGAISCRDASPTIRGCVLIGNYAEIRGGALHSNGGRPVLIDCLIAENTASEAGGVGIRDGEAVLIDCEIRDNEVFYQGGGVGTRGLGGTVTLIGCTVTRNRTMYVGDGGGGVWCDFADIDLINCLITDNVSGSGAGGAIYSDLSGHATATNCTIVGNTGALKSTTLVTARNCILWNNGTTEIVGNVDIGFCNVRGGWNGTGNIDVEPRFVRAASGDYRLRFSSPCIDAGSNDVVPVGISEDFDGNPRFVDDPGTPDTGEGTAPLVDVGAYEYQVSIACPADLDGNDAVGFADLVILLAAWGPCP